MQVVTGKGGWKSNITSPEQGKLSSTSKIYILKLVKVLICSLGLYAPHNTSLMSLLYSTVRGFERCEDLIAASLIAQARCWSVDQVQGSNRIFCRYSHAVQNSCDWPESLKTYLHTAHTSYTVEICGGVEQEINAFIGCRNLLEKLIFSWPSHFRFAIDLNSQGRSLLTRLCFCTPLYYAGNIKYKAELMLH